MPFKEGLLLNRISSCVDGVIDGELRGWIINMEHPESFEPVICRDSQGHEIAFSAFTYRQDVVAAMAVSGVFGFAIPLDLLSQLGDVVSVNDRFGDAFANGSAISLPKPPALRSRATLKIFLHIPKTAGTSLRNTLLQGVPPGEQLLIYPGKLPGISIEEFHQVALRQRNRLSWIFGHCQFGVDRHLTQPAEYITFIREPLARLRSNFAHHVAAGTQFEIDRIPVRLATVINEGLSEEFDNNMTRVIAGVGRKTVAIGRVGEDEVELALNNVRNHFCFLGSYDSVDADTLKLQTHLGLSASPLPMDNVTPPHQYHDDGEVNAVDWRAVANRNRADLRLYSLLQQEGLVSRVLKP